MSEIKGVTRRDVDDGFRLRRTGDIVALHADRLLRVRRIRLCQLRFHHTDSAIFQQFPGPSPSPHHHNGLLLFREELRIGLHRILKGFIHQHKQLPMTE